MKIFLKNAWFYNRAPFEDLKISFEEHEIAVLIAVNGKGKTTIISHIADAFHEFAKQGFENEYDGKMNKFYRISSGLESIDQKEPSIAYLRFKTSDQTNIDYINARGPLDAEVYNSFDLPEDKIQFQQLRLSIKQNNFAKVILGSATKELSQKLFNSNILTYFPSYRYEQLGYLNDPYQIALSFSKKSEFAGFLKNPIEVVTGLPIFANWLMDVVLDSEVNKTQMQQYFSYSSLLNPHGQLLNSINLLITKCLSSKTNNKQLRVGIGPRNMGSIRIQIIEALSNAQLYPSVFNLSSGEAALLCLFGELVRQADKISEPLESISGIVLIDEIDKHLHIKLQKEVLPLLLNIFPNIQFIVSSHSPFFSMGLAEIMQERSKTIDIESGLSIQPAKDKQYQEVYEMMIKENDRFKKQYDSLKSQIDEAKELQIITEGKNTEHIEKAISVMDVSLMDKVKIITGAEYKTGDQQLKNAFDIMSKAVHTSKFLFVWDCDSESKANAVEENNSFYKFCFQRNVSNTIAENGIENLYENSFFTDDVYDEKQTKTNYGGSKTEKIFNKDKFLNKIKLETVPETFENYKSLIDKIKDIIC